MKMNDAANLVEVKTTSGSITLDDELLKMGGAGTENVKAKDVLIPRLQILQSLSPQVNKKKAEFIESAEVGDFCNLATGDIYKESVELIPCHFATAYIEWVKNRGGIANNFGDDPASYNKAVPNEKNERILPNGNIVQETAQWYCLLRDGITWTRVVFPLKSTNLKHSRRWLTMCRTDVVEMPDGSMWRPPLFWRLWKMHTVDDSNDQGDWTTFRPEKGLQILEIDPSRRLIKDCMAFYEDIRTKAVVADIGDQEEHEGPTIDGKANKEPF
jgi:hypothetical protein